MLSLSSMRSATCFLSFSHRSSLSLASAVPPFSILSLASGLTVDYLVGILIFRPTLLYLNCSLCSFFFSLMLLTGLAFFPKQTLLSDSAERPGSSGGMLGIAAEDDHAWSGQDGCDQLSPMPSSYAVCLPHPELAWPGHPGLSAFPFLEC